MINFLLGNQKRHAEYHGHKLRHHDGNPNAVDTPKPRQQQNSSALEDQGTQERDDRGGDTVVKGGKEAGREDGKAHKSKGQRKNPEAGNGQYHQCRVVAHKNIGQGGGQQLGRYNHTQSEQTDHPKAFPQQPL